jgi:hypothetical protein
MQPANRVTIRNKRSGPIVDEVAEAFAAWLSRGRFQTDGRSDDGRGGVRDLDAL